jgi:hypothetical protein
MTSPIKAEMPERIAVTIYQDDTMDILMNDMYPPIGCKAYQEYTPASSLTALQAEAKEMKELLEMSQELMPKRKDGCKGTKCILCTMRDEYLTRVTAFLSPEAPNA